MTQTYLNIKENRVINSWAAEGEHWKLEGEDEPRQVPVVLHLARMFARRSVRLCSDSQTMLMLSLHEICKCFLTVRESSAE